MKARPMRDFPPGTVVFTQEWLGDDRGEMEIRETFYIIDPLRPLRYAYNVPIGRLGCVQGKPNEPRYSVVLPVPCRDPGEADGRTLCLPVSGYGLSHWKIHVANKMKAHADALLKEPP